jgi:hypothetical protein
VFYAQNSPVRDPKRARDTLERSRATLAQRRWVTPPLAAQKPLRMRFRLSTITYVFALLAAALANFGAWGFAVAGLVLLFWAWIAIHGPRLWQALLVATAASAGGAFLLFSPYIDGSREGVRGSSCRSNVHVLAKSLLKHAANHSRLPPASTYDHQGMALHSWRTALLPHLKAGATYDALDFHQPWDSWPNSTFLARAQLEWMQCPLHYEDTMSTTSYFAVVGEDTAWPTRRGRDLSEFHDGGRRTILLLESPDRRVYWAKPEDLRLDEAINALTQPLPHPAYGHPLESGYFEKPGYGIHAAFADGTLRLLRAPLPRDVATAMLTVGGADKIDDAVIQAWSRPELDYQKCYAFGVFVVLAVLPAAKLMRRPNQRSEEAIAA